MKNKELDLNKLQKRFDTLFEEMESMSPEELSKYLYKSTMSPKRKAKELIDKYYSLIPRVGNFSDNWWAAKNCALESVDEIIREHGTYFHVKVETKYVCYWSEVKEEIQKL